MNNVLNKEKQMYIFDRSGKINFIDDNDVIVGWDDEQNCCEDANWAVVKVLPEPIESSFSNLETEHESIKDFSEYVFDTTQAKPLEFEGEKGNYLNVIAFRMFMTNLECIQGKYVQKEYEAWLILSNKHNGYYSHGYTFSKPLTIVDGSL